MIRDPWLVYDDPEPIDPVVEAARESRWGVEPSLVYEPPSKIECEQDARADRASR